MQSATIKYIPTLQNKFAVPMLAVPETNLLTVVSTNVEPKFYFVCKFHELHNENCLDCILSQNNPPLKIFICLGFCLRCLKSPTWNNQKDRVAIFKLGSAKLVQRDLGQFKFEIIRSERMELQRGSYSAEVMFAPYKHRPRV